MTDLAAELAALDPTREWAAWQPSASDRWDLPKAGHLLRRAAFAGNWADLQAAVAAGPEAAVARLFAGGPGADEFDRVMDAVAPAASTVRQPGQPTDPLGVDLEGWWVHRMVLSPHPLRERMTLFWHNHFATSISKVKRPDLMRDQNQLFRTHALGKFGPLVQAVSKDPAMLVWLDSNSNVRGKPNENYARELMELFCLGVGNYSEADVREAARAFTGWHTNAEVDPNRGYNPQVKPAFVFARSLHDDGPKTVLGQTGKWDGADVVRVVLARPACPRFLARKLYRGFVGEAVTPPDALLQPLADRLRDTDLDVGDVLKVIFRSRHFYSRFAMRQRVKGPAEFTVGLLRMFDARLPAEPVGQSLSAALQELGQNLFAPPSVKGWDGGEAWLNTATVLARHNLAWRLLQGASGPHAVRLNPSGPAGADRVGYLLDLMLQPMPGEVDGRVRARLTEFVGPGGDRRVREAAHAIATLPLFQMA
ncbi:MAG: DUF1800 domain-containing protein [Gemmataceae bacterium]